MARIKRTSGRQKIELKKIENERDLYATFSKRRSGIFKKAHELCILCDTDIAIVLFSPTGKPYSFFHPGLESIMRLFGLEDQNPNPNDITFEDARRTNVYTINQELNSVNTQAEVEEKRGRMLDQMNAAHEGKGWWVAPMEEMCKEQVDKMMGWFTQLQVLSSNRINELENGASSSNFPPPNPSNAPY